MYCVSCKQNITELTYLLSSVIFQLNSKTSHFRTHIYMKFYLCFNVPKPWSLSLHFTCTLYILLIQHTVYIASRHFRFYIADHASDGIGRLVTSSILSLTTATPVASVSSLILSCVGLRYLDSHLQIINRCVLWKVNSREQNLVLEMLKFKRWAGRNTWLWL